jgi:hypothetical protein
VVNTTIAPASPSAFYRVRRQEGSDHPRAVREVEHAYQRNDLGQLLAREQVRYEQAAELPDDAPVRDDHAVQADAFTVAEDELRARIATLTALRQSLAFGAIADATKANELAGVEHDLMAAERELERTALARAESTYRQREAQQQAQQEAVRQALKRAGELGVERDRAGVKLNKAAATFASAIAALDAVASEQSQVLESVGRPGGRLSPQEVRDVLVRALALQGMRADWLES